MAEDQAEAICRRMAELRRELTGDVREVSRNARVMTDWTFYVRRFPWATVAVAAAAGFMLIPKKKQVITPDQDTLAEMVRNKQLRLDVDHKQEKPGMMRAVLTMAVTWLAKTGMSYMGERVRTVGAQKAHEHSRSEPATSSIH